MKPLYYAMLKWMTTVNEACVADAIDALKGEYGSFKMCRPKPMQEALMTAEKKTVCLRNPALIWMNIMNCVSIIKSLIMASR